MVSDTMVSKAEALDRADPLRGLREHFALSAGSIYLDGNSLGPMLKSIPARISETLEKDWADGLIRSWNDAGWVALPQRIAGKLAPLIGADPACVTIADSTSINLFKTLAAALKMNAGRKDIISEKGNFPTDLYLAEGLRDLLEKGHSLRLAETDAEIVSQISDETAVLLLTHVDFRNGRMLDMQEITKVAHEKGALVIWDLAHSAGALPIALDACDADFAVGCGYKYLNGGPGAPSFVYVNRKHLGSVRQPLTGWFSHAAPFAFDPAYTPDASINQFLCGTPPVLSMVALDEALGIWEAVDIQQVRAKSLALADFFVECLEAAGLSGELSVVTPRHHQHRGSQVSLRSSHDGYAIVQAMIARGVIGDFREPDILRFGFAPLYNSFGEVLQAIEVLQEVMAHDLWRDPAFQQRKAVT